MHLRKYNLRFILVPLAVFAAVFSIHYLWLGLFPERADYQDAWAAVQTDWMSIYISSQNYWLGFTYAMSLAFAAYAILRYLDDRARRAKKLAAGSLGFTGILALAGCFLLGCCGSPMLAVYISLFGASFLSFVPFLKPLVALITFVSISVAFIWMNNRRKTANSCPDADCNCENKGNFFKKTS